MTKTIRVLLADDHSLLRIGIRTILAAEPDLIWVGEATCSNQVQSLCQELQPDVLLLDLNMPGFAPTETVIFLREYCPAMKILILTAYDDDVYVRNVVGNGVMGYVLKDEAPETVVQAIRAVAEGKTWFSQPIIEKLVRLKSSSPTLTDREQQILRLIAQGRDNIRIAMELNLAEQTVRNYISHIYAKLEVNSRPKAVIWAREHGWHK